MTNSAHHKPEAYTNWATEFIRSFAEDKEGLTALRDYTVAHELADALQDAGLLHPGGYVTTHRAHGVLSEDGHAVQLVYGQSDPNWDKARYYTRENIEAPWRPEDDPR